MAIFRKKSKLQKAQKRAQKIGKATAKAASEAGTLVKTGVSGGLVAATGMITYQGIMSMSKYIGRKAEQTKDTLKVAYYNRNNQKHGATRPKPVRGEEEN